MDSLDKIIKALGSGGETSTYVHGEICYATKSFSRGTIVILDDPEDLNRAVELLNAVGLETRVNDHDEILCND